MPDSIVFRAHNWSHAFFARFLLALFSLFFVAGNFFRFLSFGFFPSHFSCAEGALYALALPFYFARWRKSQWVILVIALSGLYGVLLHGIDRSSLLYGIKTMGMIASGVMIGHALWTVFGPHLEKLLWFFLSLFGVLLALGTLIYLLFPQAELFFAFLDRFGVHFQGDPHHNRFISPLLDPNYYGTLATLPLLFLFVLPHKNRLTQLLPLLFFVSIVLSWSRGGIVTCLLSGSLTAAFLWCRGRRAPWTVSRLCFFGLALLCLSVLLWFTQEELLFFLRRLVFLWDDPSAYARFENYTETVVFLQETPFWGVGFNYLPKLFSEMWGGIGIDSSLITFVTCFGLIPTLGFFVYGAIWCLQRVRSARRLHAAAPLHFDLFWALLIYLGVCMGFTAWFIHLWTYPYWLIPMIALFTYLKDAEHHISNPIIDEGFERHPKHR